MRPSSALRITAAVFTELSAADAHSACAHLLGWASSQTDSCSRLLLPMQLWQWRHLDWNAAAQLYTTEASLQLTLTQPVWSALQLYGRLLECTQADGLAGCTEPIASLCLLAGILRSRTRRDRSGAAAGRSCLQLAIFCRLRLCRGRARFSCQLSAFRQRRAAGEPQARLDTVSG